MWKLLLISMLSVVAFPSFAAVTLLNHHATPIDVYGTQTTPSFNSSGASLLVVAIAYNQGCGLAFTDSRQCMDSAAAGDSRPQLPDWADMVCGQSERRFRADHYPDEPRIQLLCDCVLYGVVGHIRIAL